jgi:hypothetical protein
MIFSYSRTIPGFFFIDSNNDAVDDDDSLVYIYIYIYSFF